MTRTSVLESAPAKSAQVRRLLSRPVVHVPLAVVVLFLAAGLSGFESYTTYLVTIGVLYAVAALGLNVPAGMLGQLSLCQGAIMAVGAYTAAVLNLDLGWPLVPAALGGVVLGALLGTLVSIPSLRVGHIGFGIITLGVTLVLPQVALAMPEVTGGASGLYGVSGGLFDASSPATQQTYFVAALGAGVIAYLAHWWFRRSHLGRACLAIRSEPVGANALGISAVRYVVVGSAFSGALGGLAGAVYPFVTASVTPDAFGLGLSVLLLLMVIFGGPGTLAGPIVGAAVVGLIPIVLSGNPAASQYVYGALLIVFVLFRPRGLFSRTGLTVGTPPQPRTAATAEVRPPEDPRPASVKPVLAVHDLARSFGGVKALQSLNFDLKPGEVLGIVGPNGSGKTTALNVISGFYRPSGGSLTLLGNAVERAGPVRIARAGLGRTFQVPKIFPELTISEHVALAARGGSAAGGHTRGMEYLASLDLVRTQWSAETRTLSHGERRFLEIGLALLRQPAVLLLDEPAAGLSVSEIDRLADLIKTVAAQDGTGVVVVEHHLDFIESVVDEVVVLDQGAELWRGNAADLHRQEAVVASYLGVGL